MAFEDDCNLRMCQGVENQVGDIPCALLESAVPKGEITLALTSSLSTVLPQITFRKVSPRNYRFFQVADFICTLELINKKYEKNGRLSNSEHFFFRNYGEFRKKYLSVLNKILF